MTTAHNAAGADKPKDPQAETHNTGKGLGEQGEKIVKPASAQATVDRPAEAEGADTTPAAQKDANKDFTNPQSKAAGVTPGNILENNEPKGVPMRDMWAYQKDHMEMVSPLNRRKFTVIVVGTGLSGGAAAAALGELGYNVKNFTYHDAPRRAHSIAAQGGVNSARGKKMDNDGAYRHTKDTVKGGDYLSLIHI